MFGLGWLELLIVGGAVMLLAGPVALRRLVAAGRELQKTKDELTGPRALERLLGDGDDDEGARERERRD
jgi:Sec-independent protein translocase protein TatA